jgi:outer membrane protein assembly factor BamE (lipoprotein component of BamABCDE complex)
MMRLILLIVACLLTACAATQGEEVWNDESVTRLELGMTKAEVESIFGKPTRTQTFSDGRTAYVYLRSADEAKTSNTALKVVSLGMAKTIVVDALSIMFQDNAVTDFKYEEKADNNMTEAGGFDG